MGDFSHSGAPAGWQQIRPGGETLCARGAEFSFIVRKGDPKKVLVSFGAGGACWDDFTCDSDRIYTRTVDTNFRQVGASSGIYDFRNPANPYRTWTHVYIPYCTGDIHFGHSDTTYTRPDGSTFKVFHRGSINSRAALQWVKENYKNISELGVDGCSAGSYGSILWTPTLAESYPGAKLVQFGDSGAGVANSLLLPQWGLEKSLPSWVPGLDPAKIDWSRLSIVNVYQAIANYYPQVRFSQFNHHKDQVQTLYYAAMGGYGLDWSYRMFKNMEETTQLASNFKYFVAPGRLHCALTNTRFYTTQSDGVSLSSWLQREVSGQDVENVKCNTCQATVK